MSKGRLEAFSDGVIAILITIMVDGRVLLANLVLLFCLSIVPFATAWMGNNDFAAVPTAAYGAVSLSAAMAYYLLVRALMASPGQPATLAEAIRNDVKGKISPLAFAAAIPIGLYAPLLALAIYICVVLLWIVPDPRIERALRS